MDEALIIRGPHPGKQLTIARHIVEHNLRQVNALSLAETICKVHGVGFIATFCDKRRLKRETLARHHFLAVMRWSTDLSLPDLAHLFDMDHTTVLAAVRNWEARLNGTKKKKRAINRESGPSVCSGSGEASATQSVARRTGST